MVRNEHGRKYVEVRFFDGIYEVVRCCYLAHNVPFFQIVDFCESEYLCTHKSHKVNGSYYLNLEEALSIMEETGNLEEADRLWMEDQIRFLNKIKLGSIYGKMCQED